MEAQDGIVVTLLPLLDICYDGAVEIVTSEGVKYVQPLRLTYTTTEKDYWTTCEMYRRIRCARLRPPSAQGLALHLQSRADQTQRRIMEHGKRWKCSKLKKQKLQSELIESTVRAKVMTEQYNTLLERFCDSLR